VSAGFRTAISIEEFTFNLNDVVKYLRDKNQYFKASFVEKMGEVILAHTEPRVLPGRERRRDGVLNQIQRKSYDVLNEHYKPERG